MDEFIRVNKYKLYTFSDAITFKDKITKEINMRLYKYKLTKHKECRVSCTVGWVECKNEWNILLKMCKGRVLTSQCQDFKSRFWDIIKFYSYSHIKNKIRSICYESHELNKLSLAARPDKSIESSDNLCFMVGDFAS